MNTDMAPVVVFVYNRLSHTKQMLNSLNCLKEACKTDLFIFSDSEKDEKSKSSVDEVRKYIDFFSSSISKFKTVTIIKAKKNKGLANSIIDGVSEIINRYGTVIVVEDDLTVSDDFLRYMNNGLNYYKNDSSIWSISGYTLPLKALENYPYDVYLFGRGCSWGWATWKDRWNTVDWNVKDYKEVKFNLYKRHMFNKNGNDLSCMLDAQQYGIAQSWAIRWCYSAFKQNKMTVYPKYSRVTNSGTDGSGTNFNSLSTSKFNVRLYDGDKDADFSCCTVDNKIRKEFSKFYLSDYIKVKQMLYWFLVKIGLLNNK